MTRRLAMNPRTANHLQHTTRRHFLAAAPRSASAALAPRR